MSPVCLRLGLALVCILQKRKEKWQSSLQPALLACKFFCHFPIFHGFYPHDDGDDGDDGDNDAMIDTILFLFTERIHVFS